MNAKKKAAIAIDLALTIWHGESASSNDLNDIYDLLKEANDYLNGTQCKRCENYTTRLTCPTCTSADVESFIQSLNK